MLYCFSTCSYFSKCISIIKYSFPSQENTYHFKSSPVVCTLSYYMKRREKERMKKRKKEKKKKQFVTTTPTTFQPSFQSAMNKDNVPYTGKSSLKVMPKKNVLSFFLHVLPLNIVFLSCAKRLRSSQPIAKGFPNKNFSRSGNTSIRVRFLGVWLHFSRDTVSIYFATCAGRNS